MTPSDVVSGTGTDIVSNRTYGLEPAAAEPSSSQVNRTDHEPYEWLITAGPAPFDACSSIFRNKLQDPRGGRDNNSVSDQFSTNSSGFLTLSPTLSTSWSLFRSTAESVPEQHFLGHRPIQVCTVAVTHLALSLRSLPHIRVATRKCT